MTRLLFASVHLGCLLFFLLLLFVCLEGGGRGLEVIWLLIIEPHSCNYRMARLNINLSFITFFHIILTWTQFSLFSLPLLRKVALETVIKLSFKTINL